MKQMTSVVVLLALLAPRASAQWISNVRFAEPKPLRYFPPRHDYRHGNCPEETVRYDARPGTRIMVLACPVGECVLGANVVRPVVRFLGRGDAKEARVRIVVSVKEPGRPARQCNEKSAVVSDAVEGVAAELAYTIERPGEEQVVLVDFYGSDPTRPDVHVQVPCPNGYLGRIVLTRPTYWADDPSVRAWLALNLDRAHLAKYQARIALKSKAGEVLRTHTFRIAPALLLPAPRQVSRRGRTQHPVLHGGHRRQGKCAPNVCHQAERRRWRGCPTD